MSRDELDISCQMTGAPRVSGDEPFFLRLVSHGPKCSPRERG